MIEKRFVQWYASDAGVDLDIAEREIALTYVLRILANQGLLKHLAFKGGTAIRKLHLANQGRFSLDLDFTALDEVDPVELILDFVGALHDQTHYGLTFSIPASDYYTTQDSCGAEVTYSHDWVKGGRFGIQISLRAQPLLPVRPMKLRDERYFEWIGFDPPEVPSLDLHEIIGEKIRAAAQRSRVRDLYDLYQLANLPVDQNIIRRIVVIKCWETRFAFKPSAFWEGLSSGHYDWGDLRRLVRRSGDLTPEMIIHRVRKSYDFLNNFTDEETVLAKDPYHREQQTYQLLVNSLKQS
jgi:predicted nucleotidyltransferase component of viral defense system